MIRKNILAFGWIILSITSVFAREGMWIPTLLNKYNIEEMKQMGFRLTADDIYNINQVSMKDAVVLFGTGCTGELISDEGLLITNHHCGIDAIQNHSTVEHDYLTNGFWAKNQKEELPNPELWVSFLERMEDVTDRILADTFGKSKDSVALIITRNTRKIISEADEKGKFEAVVLPLFYGNQYFLYVYQVFRDVRLVGAPPSSIGKFGGDTDNWMWPRHTGDFSLFRIYAGKDNQPAGYSPDNVPYKPKKFFKISLKGIQPEDFTMVLGYPAKTQEFLPSPAIRQIMEQSNPDKIKIRDIKLNLLSSDMEKDAKVRIQYTTKYQNTGNAWKKWQGELKGLRRLNAIEAKQKTENDFRNWIGDNSERQKKYANVLPQLEQLYTELAPYAKANDYYSEIVQRGTDLFTIISYFDAIEKRWSQLSAEDRQKIQKAIEVKIEEHLKEYNPSTDEKVFSALIRWYAKASDPKFLPADFKSMMLKTNQDELILKLYRKSVFSDPEKLKSLASDLNTGKLKLAAKDPAFSLFRSLKNSYELEVEPHFSSIQKQIDEALKTYVAGILEMNEGKKIWPDANKTFRVSYGKVEGYKPMDGVRYNYFTTLKGIIEKDNPAIYDYDVPQKLRELYRQKDYGRYGNEGELNVCFTASNHTTGGNSGSPVLDAEGNLIGVNFDRCWEGTMSDLMFDPDRCRNIILDIRYTLFIIDKFAGAGYLLNEMEIR